MQKRQTLKDGEYEEFEQDLYSWFETQRRKHLPISKEIVCEKAKKLFTEKYGNERKFMASNGWFQNFKKRFSFRDLKICGEKLSSRPDLLPQFQSKLNEIIESEGFLDAQIYNADESALFYKMLPDKTLVHEKEKNAPGRKMCKERITFMCCSNKAGDHKLDIIVIGKSRNPRSFKNNPPVEYYSSKNGWMTTHLFMECFHKSFVPKVNKFQQKNNLTKKAILLVDNAPSHSKEAITSACGKYKVMFLPPNTTSLVQPMDQNPIRLTKLFYKKSLVCEMVSADEENYTQFLK